MTVQLHKHTGIDSPRVNAKDIDGLIKGDEVMNIVGVETINGIKTFGSIPVLPASDPTADNEMVRKKYVDDDFLASTITETDEYLVDSADTNVNISAQEVIDGDYLTYVKVKQVTYNEVAGDIRAKFDLKDANGSGGMFGRVYINGVAQGTEQEETSSTWTTYSEDFSVSNGDEIQIYLRYDGSGGGVGGDLRNFRLYYYKKLDITAGTVNTD